MITASSESLRRILSFKTNLISHTFIITTAWRIFAAFMRHRRCISIISRPHRMNEMWATAIDDPVAWASVSLFVTLYVCQSVCLSSGRLFLFIRQMAPLRGGRYYITVTICFWPPLSTILLGSQEFPLQTGSLHPFSRFAGRSRVSDWQIRHATGLSITIGRISCIRCGLDNWERNKKLRCTASLMQHCYLS